MIFHFLIKKRKLKSIVAIVSGVTMIHKGTRIMWRG